MTKEQQPQTSNTSQDLVIDRVFGATPERVWQAFSDAETLKKWWGHEAFTVPFGQIDFRVGGKYLICMRSAEGTDFWSTGTYREIVPLERIVCTDSFADPQGNVVPATYYDMSPDFPLELLITFSFKSEDGKTRLRLQHAGLPEEDRDMCADGWDSALDKLGRIL